MATAVAVLASLGFIGWLIYRAVKGKPFKAHVIAYGVACVTGIFTLAYFLSMDIPKLVKIVASILLGVALIVVASYFQHRRQVNKS
jgi:glucan phosphoethanolaminetransferase (alkaline phosphatase superfamily)